VSIVEFYEIVVDVAAEILSPQQLAKFLRRLTERITR
jgi:hypothetical protein